MYLNLGLLFVFLVLIYFIRSFLISKYQRAKESIQINEQERIKIIEYINNTPYVPKTIESEDIDDGRNFDVIIVGAGIAGCPLAKALSDQGRNVLLVERDISEPDRIVGELLQPGGVQKLRELGLGECLRGIDGQPSFGYAVYPSPDEGLVLEFPHYGNPQQPYGVSFHHGRFIQNLRYAATQAKVHLTEGTVSEILKQENRVIGISYKTKRQEAKLTAYAPLTIVVDGCASNFRKDLCENPTPVSNSKFYGLILKCQLPNPGYGHVILTHPGVLLAYTIGNNETRVLVDVANSDIPENSDLQKFFLDSFLTKIPPILQNPFKEAVEAGKIRSMPCITLHPTPLKYKGVLILGDAWNMRLPLTGGGMTVAFSDVLVLSNLLRKMTDFSDLQQLDSLLKEFYSTRIGVSRAINMLAYSLYCVLRGADAMRTMCDGCVAYFRLGPKATDTPMALLGGLEPSAFPLIYHYTLVALYSVYYQISSFPSISSFWISLKMIIAAIKVILFSKNEMFPCKIK